MDNLVWYQGMNYLCNDVDENFRALEQVVREQGRVGSISISYLHESEVENKFSIESRKITERMEQMK